MNEFGSVCLLLALALSGYSIVASVLGALRRDGRLVRSGEAAALSVTGLVTLAMIALWVLLGRSDMSNEYVWGHSNRDLGMFYKISSLWAGQAGSLMLWHWILLLFAASAIVFNRNRNRELMPWATAVMLASSFFFGLLNSFVASPFKQIMNIHADGSMTPFFPDDGRGLNPLLQHPAMVIHPPLLYLGYIGFVVPFAFCIAALITKRLDSEWMRSTRRWTLISWFFLAVGILLGARWAYVELGWGGYWAWDPVENASLMPWLTGTAFLHSVMMQEKKGMMKVWNVVLICLTYTLSIFGTFLTRSGVVSSVHAFAQSSIGGFFAVFLALMIIGWVVLIRIRLPYLRSEARIESTVSRESSFLFNNLLLLVICLVVLWGTIFPVLSEAVTGEKIVVGTPYFNKLGVPLGLLLMILTGIGPLIAWRRSSWRSVRKVFMWPALVGVACGLAPLAFGWRDFYALATFGVSGFVTATVAFEFFKGARARARSMERGLFAGVVDLMNRNHRRYGGYLVHLGMVLLFVGFAGKAFNTEAKRPLRVGEEFTLRGYTFRSENLVENEMKDPNYVADRMTVAVLRGDKRVATLRPERRLYIASQQPTTEVSRYANWREDVYTVFVRVAPEAPPELQVFINPLVRFVWLGGIVLGLGTLFAMLPDRRGSSRTGMPARAQQVQEGVHA